MLRGLTIQVFEYLSKFSKILVTGPQRSGTTICAAMIAEDLGYTFYPEERIDVSNLRKMKELFQSETNFVLQTPALMKYAGEVAGPDTAIVVLRRNIEDIVASEKRINWLHRPIALAQYGLAGGVISEIRYRYWEEYQKDGIPNTFEIEYESLSSHPLWVSRERRVNFSSRQIRENQHD